MILWLICVLLGIRVIMGCINTLGCNSYLPMVFKKCFVLIHSCYVMVIIDCKTCEFSGDF